ncbi:UPF0565 protein C2orf69 homolog [Colletes gigas]|uniref:UPF0565 protein C2orf69 homolog n=1 Tax=Colletes gigas TaxID=935657 RepID=UPI001C9AF909|nr:UPF0565 protein C2orf69 homolog [Colletes gigas]XP_043262310.1 UPF0565 protein C2orf69 homolog [Colletes gigas]XP_043262311.1 UPF0565 protein C2orf69 homolog [Colletes gigas]XP_043262312.1 UPF0565 protein C2orf69 homolog [Colletes gigas]XP_043262313.1 UPF0565 protein C2orf69 homolog [Colletes gigas]XP_043262314.1 UPF0565 protein C2orf69 homolog [Colletes gigas]XP_043262315.1 UPF0565 protein C2orf69 homolog [Colletes gigas]
MSFKTWIWKNVPGIAGRCNDIIYSRSILPQGQDILVYFGGDVQDIQENMEQYTDSKKYTEWSLENSARILATNFPDKHVLVVRPSRKYVSRSAVYSCFDNFVPSDEYGIPSFTVVHNALKHLQELIKSSLEHFKTSNIDENSAQFNMEKIRLSLMGFSKGCVVLNQLLHEFHYYQNKSEPDIEINNFIKLVESMWWLDGGHAGSKDTWITEKSILESFAKLKIDVHVDVTPYQVKDSHRPWIRKDENRFCSILQNMGIPVERILHFADLPRSLTMHFNILKVIGNR